MSKNETNNSNNEVKSSYTFKTVKEMLLEEDGLTRKYQAIRELDTIYPVGKEDKENASKLWNDKANHVIQLVVNRNSIHDVVYIDGVPYEIGDFDTVNGSKVQTLMNFGGIALTESYLTRVENTPELEVFVKDFIIDENFDSKKTSFSKDEIMSPIEWKRFIENLATAFGKQVDFTPVVKTHYTINDIQMVSIENVNKIVSRNGSISQEICLALNLSVGEEFSYVTGNILESDLDMKTAFQNYIVG